MQLNENYANLLVSVASVYGQQRSTECAIAESIFEEELFSLFASARQRGVSLQDVIVIASTALAVILTKPQEIEHQKNKLDLVKPKATKQAQSV